MKTLIKNVMIVFPGNPMHGKKATLLTDGKKILKLGGNEDDAKQIIDANKMVLIPGLVDVQCHSGEPGFEDKEDLESLSNAARKGGYTDLFILPSTDPVIDSKSAVAFINNATGTNGVSIHALGAISKGLKGTELSEMYDMHTAGAKAFTDGKRPICDVNLMKRALYYAKNFNGIVMSFPNDDRLSPGGMVNESPANTLLGLKSTPSLAEELMLNRDIYLLRYAGSALHVATISTKGSVRLIKLAKKDKLDLTASVAMSNLLFNEDALETFDTRYKVNPPLRSEADRKVLLKAVEDGSIDIIVSDHTPEVIENKDVEFDQAEPGVTMLESTLAAYNTHLSTELSLDSFILATSINPRKRFGLDMPIIEEGAPFSFTLFDPNAKWTYTMDNKGSKSSNSPFIDQELKGKVIEF